MFFSPLLPLSTTQIGKQCKKAVQLSNISQEQYSDGLQDACMRLGSSYGIRYCTEDYKAIDMSFMISIVLVLKAKPVRSTPLFYRLHFN